MRQGYTSTLPNDDNGGGGGTSSSAISSQQTFFDRVRKMWNKPSNNESAPLLDRKHMTLEPPKRTTTKVTLTAVLLVFTMLLFGAGIAVWIETEPVFETRPLSETERLVLNLPSNDSIHDHFHVYASKVHMAGSDVDRQQAEWTRDKWIEMGVFNTTIETYYPLLTQPKEQRFALVTGPEELRFEATMHEKVLVGEDGDDETIKHPAAFHAYSKNGSALGPVVYANYGGLKDFQLLLDRGIALAGTIALMRAGNGIPDGTKIRVAEKFGCIGALIYPDPIDDGPFNKHGFPHTHPAEPYPNGPWRPSSSIRSGSVEFSSLASGDPLTPGWAATKNTTRLNMDEAQVLPNIPSLPLSYHDALSLLKAMQGRGTLGDISWKGGLPDVSYYSGPTEGNAELVNIVDNKVAPVWNVIGVMHGSQEPDHAVILGNRRDAWGYGAVDSSSGSAVMVEVAKVFGTLLNKGWRPARTIILASWDASEYSMAGSNEWMEYHKDWLDQHAAVYINVGAAVSGPHFAVQASPSLKRLIYDIARFVPDPQSGTTVYEAWAEFTNRTSAPSTEPTIGNIVSKSDFAPFLHHAGIASINMGFMGDFGVQHSIYDSIHWMETFGDPDYRYHMTLVKIWALLAIRLSDSPILPLHPGDYAATLSLHWKHLSEYYTTAHASNLKHVDAYARPFRLLYKSIHKLTKLSGRLEEGLGLLESEVHDYQHLADVPSSLKERLDKVNDRLALFERYLLDPEGIYERPWYKHVIYGPRMWSDHTIFPGIMDAIDAQDRVMVAFAEQRVAMSIRNAAKSIKM